MALELQLLPCTGFKLSLFESLGIQSYFMDMVNWKGMANGFIGIGRRQLRLITERHTTQKSIAVAALTASSESCVCFAIALMVKLGRREV